MGIFDMKCGTCSKSFATVEARKSHERDKHGIGVAAITVDDDDDDDGFDPVAEEAKFPGYRDRLSPWLDSDKKRLTIIMLIDADTDRLYHHDIGVAIAYLAEMKDRLAEFGGGSLQEHWTGHETMQMVFAYTRRETDAEYTNRQQCLVEQRARAKRDEEAAKAREGRRKQYEALRREFG